MLKAAQYLRMSTDRQRYSLASQKAAIGTYAEAHGFEIIETYEDAAKSGVTIAGRDGLKALLRDVVAGAPFSAILVFDVSRWGRYQDPDQAAHYEFICREAGVDVRYCAEPFESDGSPTSALIKSIKRVMAAEYSRQLSDRCRSALRRHMLAGGKAGGTAPYGFARQILEDGGQEGRILRRGERRGPGQIVRLVRGSADEVAVVRRIFRLFVSDRVGVTAIAHRLNAEGVQYRQPGPWNECRVRYILRNEMSIGVYAFNRTAFLFGKVVARNSRQDWIRVKVAPAIVAPALFRAAQTKLDTLNRNKWTDDEMIENLRALLKEHGFITRSLIDRSDGIHGVVSYNRRFGSLEVALAKVPYVSDYKRHQLVDKAGLEPAEIIRRLKEMLAEKGFLNTAEITVSPRLPSIRVIVRKFGCLENAYRAAGFDLTRGEMILAGRERRKASRLDREVSGIR